MKNKNLKQLALLGLASGLLTSQQLSAANSIPSAPIHSESTTTTTKANSSTDSTTDPNSENLGYHLLTEEELFENLNAKSRALYESLDAEGKELALKVASQRCNGTNECRGLNACETANNSCAGQGSCKGKSKCAHADKNMAVKLVAKRMAEKRANLNKD